MILHWATGVLLFVAALLIYLILRRATRTHFFLGHRTDTEVFHRKCMTCDGCGVVMIDGSIIKPEHRVTERVKGGYVQRGKIANTKTCTGLCGGMGRYWVEGEFIRPISTDRRPDGEWQ
jgi:hypothetical protein